MEYEKMLGRLYASLPKEATARERFELPVPDSHTQGNRTIVKNFGQILKALRRDEKHFLKVITKGTATSANVESGRLILKSRFSPKQVSDLIANYVKRYVLCHECKRPDTKITEQHGVKMLKCDACGALSPVENA